MSDLEPSVLQRLAIRIGLVLAANVLVVTLTMADGPPATQPLAIVGSPSQAVVVRDAQHCRADPGPQTQLSADRVEIRVRTSERISIALSERRGRSFCGGSLSLIPEAGRGYAVRLTPGDNCAEQLFSIDPRAQPPMLLLGTDNHPQDPNLEEFICATRHGSPGSTRLSVGGNVGGVTGTKVEIGTSGYCGKFDDSLERASSVEVAPGVKHWVRLKFPELVCEVTFSFTPIAGVAYFVKQDETYYFGERGKVKCEAHLLRVDAADAISPEAIEGEPNRICPLSH